MKAYLTQAELIKSLLTADDTINYITGLLSSINTGKQEDPKKILKDWRNQGKLNITHNEYLEIDDAINDSETEIALNSFKAGIDFAFTLLGHDSIFKLAEEVTE